MARNCTKCSNPIPEGRLKIFPNIHTCVACSSIEKVHGIPITVGEGDYTYNDIVILSDDEYKRYTNRETNADLDDEIINLDEDEKPVVVAIPKTLMDELPEDDGEVEGIVKEFLKGKSTKKRKLRKI